MKSLLLLLLLSGFALLGSAQVSLAQSGPTDVVVHSFQWQLKSKLAVSGGGGSGKLPDYSSGDLMNPDRRPTSSPRYDPNRLELPAPKYPTIRSDFQGYQSSLQLENTGAKTVVSIEWEHLFFSDKEKRREVRRFAFQAKTELRPGDQAFISQQAPLKKPLKLPPPTRQSVVINRITYSDGSAWQRN